MKNKKILFDLPGKHIFVLGLTETQRELIYEMQKRGGRPTDKCYLCKRERYRDKSVVLCSENRAFGMDSKGKVTDHAIELEFLDIEVNFLGKCFHYLVCKECAILIQPGGLHRSIFEGRVK